MLSFFVNFLILIIFILISVAFLTLMERKVLGYIQIRKGPNKVGYMGIIQPFSDAIKLFSKEQTYPLASNYIIYYYSPVFSLFLSLIIWVSLPSDMGYFYFDLGLLFILCCLSMGVYTLMIAGWSSNSNYSLLGSLRGVAQTISYEVSLSLILISFMILIGSYSMMDFLSYQYYVWLGLISIPLIMIWLVSMMAETNRTPFDFAEGESELVSGFNVEYSSGGFALIFLAEYSSILFMSMMFSVMFLGGGVLEVLFYLKIVFLSFLFLWIRGTLPRFRYDKLMYLAWSSFLPISLNFLFVYLGVKFINYSFLI
uniref:NADH-ubiquinone oxidoreductase chain 1 n=1 Tax=Rhysodes sp. BMNH-844233 TaxID=1909167 RepID=A0A343A4D0_9CARA|nr:NADH dehydrogenase subunit 1 [Rhysodes sp. BMNH-844233]